MQLKRLVLVVAPLSAAIGLGCGDNSSRTGDTTTHPSQTGRAGSGGSDAGTGGSAGSSGTGGSISGGTGGTGAPGSGGSAPGGATGTGGAAGNPLACADLFDQGQLQTYDIDISADQWAAMDAEFHNLTALATGLPFANYHPITFHLNSETVTNAEVKLHGQSSWEQTVMYDGDHAKMQFDVSFDKIDPNGNFHGVGKLVFDMPRDDWTFMHDRLSQAWLRQAGILAPCSASARLNVNGAYYGLYVLEQGVGSGTVKAFFPNNAGGDLWNGGSSLETKTAGNTTRLKMFQNAKDLTSLAAIMDIPGSINSWAGEALINDSDGYYNGSHNFWLYDEGAAGYLFQPKDTDSTWDWLEIFDLPGAQDHPVYWWSSRAKPTPVLGDKWLIVLGDATWRKKYADALETLLGKYDVAQLQGWIDSWSQQIKAAATSDPHAAATAADIQMATQVARDIIPQRAAYLQSFVDCENGVAGAATDADGDGYLWCDECDDSNPGVHPGAKEICGNGIDDDCNGFVDDGC